MRISAIARGAGLILAVVVGVGALGAAPAVAASDLDRYLDLPLVNRDAARSPGGVNPELPYDHAELGRLLDEARAEGVAPARYAALLYQYWLVDATEKAGIDLRRWD